MLNMQLIAVLRLYTAWAQPEACGGAGVSIAEWFSIDRIEL